MVNTGKIIKSVYIKPTIRRATEATLNVLKGEAAERVPSGAEAASSYGKAAIKKTAKILKTPEEFEHELEITSKKIRKSYDSDTIPLPEAVRELDMLDLTENQKADLLLGCVFQTKSTETLISRPALYTAKYVILDCYGKVPNKLDKAIRTAIFDEEQVFSNTNFLDLFKKDTWTLKRNVDLKRAPTGGSELSKYCMTRKGEIFDALKKHSTKRNQIKISAADIFVPLDKVGENISTKLDNLVEEGVSIPEDLKKAMKKALSEYNFNLKKVYADHYSLLKECETLEDVKTLYPELKYPTEIKRTIGPTNTNITYTHRMQQNGIDKPVIEALSKMHTEFTPRSKTFIHLGDGTATNVENFRGAGYEFSEPDKKLLAFLNECEETQLKYRRISRISQEKLQPLIEKHALRTSKVWSDFHDLTGTGTWLPVRLIKNKRAYPENTKYSTENLVDTYLFNLFVRNPNQRYSKNPLKRFDKVSYLDEHAHGIINRTYITRYLSKEKDIPVNISEATWTEIKPAFEDFKQRFDIEAIGKSIEHMEDNYHRHFYRNYWTNERFATLQKQMQKSQDIAYEKVIWGEELRKKEVDIEQVKQIVRSEDASVAEAGVKLIDEKDFKNYKYQISKIQDAQLKEKFMSAIAQGRESNEEYYDVFNKILKESVSDGNIDETKAKALITIHENFLSEVLEGTQNITEAQYTDQIIAKYKTPNGTDFAKILADTQAENKYWELASEIINRKASDFVTELERRFGDDYVGMNEIMEKYLRTPDAFKEKFSNIYTTSTPSCPNIVLHRELTTFLDKIDKWHFDRDEILMLDKLTLGQNNDKFEQNIVIPKELKGKLWDLSGKNYEEFDDLSQKLYKSGQKRTGDSKGNGIKTWTGKDYAVELKIVGEKGGWRLYAREATPQDIEKYGNVKYVFYDASKTH